MHVKELWVYPVKSMAGSSVQEAELEARGFKNDRRWMLVDQNGRFISQREYPSLALWRVTVKEGVLLLEHSSTGKRFEIPNAKTYTGELIDVEVWDTHFKARLVTLPNEVLLEDVLGFSGRLVYMANDNSRGIDPKYAKEGEEVSFADGYPYLMTNTASLKTLSDRYGQSLEMRRFRPNIVVEDDTPFSEDNWTALTIGKQYFRIPKPCARCIIITIDPKTTTKDPRVMAELANFRKVGRKILFGMNGIWEGNENSDAILRVGDVVSV